MGKILALDIGDKWTGIAITDSARICARPYKTVDSNELIDNLNNILSSENIETIVIGYPKTMRGTESEQTKKTLVIKEKLEKQFKNITFILWDERLSSERARSLNPCRSKEEKLKSHALAAAFIADSYLTFLRISQENER